MKYKKIGWLLSFISIANGLSYSEDNSLSPSEVQKLVQRIRDGMDENPHLLEECRALPTDRRVRLLMYATSGATGEIVPLGRRLLRETPGWDDYIEERLKLQWPLAYAYRKMGREALLGGPQIELSTEQQKIYEDANFEIIRIYNMLRYIGDPKAVRFLMIGIYDNTPGYQNLDVVSGPAARGPIEMMGLAMSKAGGELVVPNTPKSTDVEVWRKWWDENKHLYIPPGKSDLFTEYGVVQTPIPPRPAWVSKVRLMQTPEPTPNQPVATPAPAPGNHTSSSTKSWAIAGAIGALLLMILTLLRRAKR